MTHSYRSLFRICGVPFLVLGFAARLPLAMSQIGSLLLVAGATGSYAAGGLVAGTIAIANAIGAPIAGTLADRFGQRPVLLVQSIAAGVALAALVLRTQAGSALPMLLVLAAVAGVALPQAGTLARVRWRSLTARERQPQLLGTAFAYEGVADEVSFVLGPAIVGLLAALGSPAVALLGAAALVVVGGVGFALHPTSPEPAGPGPRGTSSAPLLTGRFVLLLVAMLSIGIVFGSVQTGSSVLATAAGSPGLTGGLHALLGIGSATAGLLLPLLPQRFALADRLAVFGVAMFVLALPLLAVSSLPTLAGALVLLGFAAAPWMITVFTMAERTAPVSRITTALTIVAGMTGVGYALGSSLAGRLADWGGHRPAFAVTVAAGLLAAVVAGIIRRSGGSGPDVPAIRELDRSPDPGGDRAR